MMLWNDLRQWIGDDRIMFAVLVSGINFIFTFGLSTIYWVFWELQLFQKYKINPNEFPDKNRLLITARDILVGYFTGLPLVCYFVVFAVLSGRAGGVESFMDGELIPPFRTMITQVMVLFAMTDTIQYWVHRLLHEKKFLYINFHKEHHTYKVCTGVMSFHNHPAESVFLALAQFLGPFAVGPHAFTYCVWVAFIVAVVTEQHGGYHFPYSPFPGWADRHDFHHSRNVGSYGISPFWDKIMKTDTAYMSWKAAQIAAMSKKV